MQPETIGWPSSTTMTTLLSSVTAASSSTSSSLSTSSASTGILNGSLDSYLVLDSACSHRPVFRIRGFFRTIAYDASVKMVDSNGKSTVAEGIGEAMCSLPTVSPTGAPAGSVNLAFSEAVLNTKCPVNLLAVSNLLIDKDGKARDNDVSFKKLKITLSESDPATRKIIPIEYKHGLFVVRFALLFAASVAPANSKKE